MLSKKEYEYLTGRDNGKKNVLAYHIRQSFKPGEVTPQEALEIANRGYVIQVGKIVQHGTAHELLDSDEVRKAYMGM